MGTRIGDLMRVGEKAIQEWFNRIEKVLPPKLRGRTIQVTNVDMVKINGQYYDKYYLYIDNKFQGILYDSGKDIIFEPAL